MVKLTIDGREASVREGSTILEAAASAGIEIPTLCYLKELNEISACRICMAEVQGTRDWSRPAVRRSQREWWYTPTQRESGRPERRTSS